MNLISLVVVVLRLMALKLFCLGGLQIIHYFSQERTIYADNYFDIRHPFPWLMFSSLVFLSLALWVMALPVARMVTHGVSTDLSFGALALVDCYTLAFMGIGLYFVLNYLPYALKLTDFIFRTAATGAGDSWKQDLRPYEVSETFIPLALGAVLFYNARKWAMALAKRDISVKAPAAPASIEAK